MVACSVVGPVRPTSTCDPPAENCVTAVPRTPPNRASPPARFSPATRPCLLACVPSGTYTRAPPARTARPPPPPPPRARPATPPPPPPPPPPPGGGGGGQQAAERADGQP